jgi:hypothetical protein
MPVLPWNRRRAATGGAPAPTAEHVRPPAPAALSRTDADPDRRELAARAASGIRVVLFWRPSHDDVIVAVDDDRTGERFELSIARERALHAFHHPFVYA